MGKAKITVVKTQKPKETPVMTEHIECAMYHGTICNIAIVSVTEELFGRIYSDLMHCIKAGKPFNDVGWSGVRITIDGQRYEQVDASKIIAW